MRNHITQTVAEASTMAPHTLKQLYIMSYRTVCLMISEYVIIQTFPEAEMTISTTPKNLRATEINLYK